MIDVHCHLLKEEYDDLDNLLNILSEENIVCINNGCDLNSNIEVIDISKKYKNIYASIGFHPSSVEDFPIDFKEFIEKNIENIVAIGEIGLDFHWDYDKTKQIYLFEEQLSIAEKYNLPVIVHCRDSIMETYNILKKYKVKGVIHSFSGSYEMAIKFIKLGYKLGIGGVITFKNCKLKEVIKKIDLNDIVLETDSPYLTPVPYRGKKNSPLFLNVIAEFISNLKGVSIDDVYRITFSNAISLFDLKDKI